MRGPRLEIPGGFYHVMARGNNRAALFDSDAHYVKCWHLMGEATERFGWNVHAVTLMPNHFHLLIELTETTLSRGMHWLQTCYAGFRNAVTARVGHVFQGRFRSILCEEEPYLLELVRYIHMNPVRRRLVAHPEEWRWSSHVDYLGLRGEPWIQIDDVLERFGAPGDDARSQRYHNFVVERAGPISRKPVRTAYGWVLGSERFVEQVKRGLGIPVRRHDRSLIPRPSLEALSEQAASFADVPAEALISVGRQPKLTRARAWLAATAVRIFGYRMVEVARFLRRDHAIVTRLLRRAEGDPWLQQRLSESVWRPGDTVETRFSGPYPHKSQTDPPPRGNTMVEAALVLPVVMVAVFGCLEFIQVSHAMTLLHRAAAEGARAAALGADPAPTAAAAVMGLLPPRAVYGGVTLARARLSLDRRGGVSVVNPPLTRVTATARALYRPPLGRWPVTLQVTAASPTEPMAPRP